MVIHLVAVMKPQILHQLGLHNTHPKAILDQIGQEGACPICLDIHQLREQGAGSINFQVCVWYPVYDMRQSITLKDPNFPESIFFFSEFTYIYSFCIIQFSHHNKKT